MAASIFRTFENGVLNDYKFKVDLELGLQQLIMLNENPDGALVVRYEDLTGNPRESLARCSDFLGLNPPLNPDQPPPRLTGEMGDPTGQFKMTDITNQPESDYLKFIDSKFRKQWFLSFLKRIGPTDFEHLGYSYAEHQEALERHPVRKLIGLRDLGFLVSRKVLEILTFRVLPRRPEEVPDYILY